MCDSAKLTYLQNALQKIAAGKARDGGVADPAEFARETLKALETLGEQSPTSISVHEHIWLRDGDLAHCRCGEIADAWWCPDSPDHLCHYSTDPDSCDFCGLPDERK